MAKKTRENNATLFGSLFKGFGKKRHAEPNYPTSGHGYWQHNWRAPVTGPNTNIESGGGTILSRSRDLTRKSSLIKGGYETLSSNLVGSGIRALSQADNPEARRQIDKAWEDWCECCDIEGLHSFAALLDLAVRQRYEAGEVFIRHIMLDAADGATVPYRLQLLEAEMVPQDKNEQLTDNHVIIGGIEFDGMGRRLAYHIYKRHPGDAHLFGGLNIETVRVPAEEIIHYYKPLRPGQARGLPENFPAQGAARDLMIYDMSELTRKVISSNLTGFIISDEQDDFFNEEEAPGVPGVDIGEALGRVEPGMFHYMRPGEDVKFNPPAESGTSYLQFLEHNLRGQAAALGITYEQFSGDLSKVNFSSIRAGLNESQRKARQEQARIVGMICKPIRRLWLKQAVLSGALDMPGYALNPEKYNGVRFYPPGWAYVNPVQEVQAQILQIDNKLKSRSQVITEMGGDPNEVDEMIRQDALREKELGIARSAPDETVEVDETII